MRLLLLAPFALLLPGCASIGIGAFIVTPILFMAFIIACIWALVRLVTGSSDKNLEKAKFEHQKEMDYRAYEASKKTPPPPAYTPTLPTPTVSQNLALPKAKEIQECPYCKEDILVGAVICKHCRSSL